MSEDSDFHFNSNRGRADLNPYVDKLDEYGPYAMTSEQGEAVGRDWQGAIGLPPDAPLLLEIGPGNGFFFREVARRWPEAALVGVEVRFKRVWLTARKAREWDLTNFRSVHHHSGHLPDLFAPGSLSVVYVNHPDPWPKERHHKHRLLQPSFAATLAALLRPGGEVWVKSDFPVYGPLARDVFAAEGWSPIAYTEDLHGQRPEWRETAPAGAVWWAGDLMTNYERKTLKKGERIAVAGFRRD